MDRGVETLGGSRLAVVGCVCLFFSIPSIKTQVHPRRPARRRRVKSLINPSVKMFKSKFVPSPLLWLPARLAARARWGLFGLAPPGSLAIVELRLARVERERPTEARAREATE